MLTVTDKAGTVSKLTEPDVCFFTDLQVKESFQALVGDWFALPIQVTEGPCLLIYFENLKELVTTKDGVVARLKDGTELKGLLTGPLHDDAKLVGRTSFGYYSVKISDVTKIEADPARLAEYAKKLKADRRIRHNSEKISEKALHVTTIRGATYDMKIPPWGQLIVKEVGTSSPGRYILPGATAPARVHRAILDNESDLLISTGSGKQQVFLTDCNTAEFSIENEEMSVRLTANDGATLTGKLYSGAVNKGIHTSERTVGLWGFGTHGPMFIPIKVVKKVEALK